MVTFSPDIRYSQAWREGQRQERIMQQVMQLPGIENRWNSREVEDLMLRLVEETR
jgi:kynurenine 3-monooxygenase